ncbi:pyridoxamine 5'-phosphate oxidase family protein [Tepidibacter mesophilus]|uniref:pyridoxamine 5'-phosphate oxidase family protein n=1 Tax=Tepidibacter mesophilus TaxID=655607 RepID=UPI000C08418A|nr:pyridoxamine 5'-phosphate oxidase family protein [Tepidibacter mesophilus]
MSINYVKILKENLCGVLATRNNTGVSTRAFQFLFANGNKVYFGTSNDKPVYDQLTEIPEASFCSHAKDYSSVLSIDGPVTFVEDKELKERALNEYPAIKEIYKSSDNELFKIFYMDVKRVQTYDFVNGAHHYTI